MYIIILSIFSLTMFVALTSKYFKNYTKKEIKIDIINNIDEK